MNNTKTYPSATRKAVIIGAGISGLQIASLLQSKGFQVVILEAKDRIGGRIKEDRNLADFPIEAGAEEVHGENSLHYKIAKEVGGEFVDESVLSYFVEYGNKLYHEDELIKENKAFERVLNLDWKEILTYDDNKPDITLSDYIKEYGFPDNLRHTVDGIFATEWSTDLENLSVKGIKKWNIADSGRKNFILKNMSNYEVITKKFAHVLNKVLLNTPVEAIDYGMGSQVQVRTKTGKTFEGDLVVVSVPISQLQKGSIAFKPDLPESKKQALKKVKMDSTIKVSLNFNKQFWDERLGNIITKGVISLMWPSSTGGKSKKCHVLTGLITGKKAERLSALSQEEALQIILDDLRRVYGSVVDQEFAGHLIQDWTKEEYIEGGYTFPNINENEDTRKILGESMMDKVFFVGEGVCTKFALISGAMKSSFIAYKEICEKILNEKVDLTNSKL